MINKLPEKWCIKSNSINAKIIREKIVEIFNININDYKETMGWWYTNDIKGNCSRHYTESKEVMMKNGYIEISFDDFERLILNKKKL